MSYRFKVKEPLAEGFQRIAFDQIEIAESELRGNADADAAVHNARRALKRLRALLRLVRPAMNEADYTEQSQRFAATGRVLAGARDAHVMRQTLRKLSAATPGLGKSFTAAFETVLASSTSPAHGAARDRTSAARQLAAARERIVSGSPSALDLAHVFDGMEAVYRKARKLHQHCSTGEAADEDFHALRKCVQRHWRHMQLLTRGWPEAFSARADEAKALSQLLGEDHDLHVLRSFTLTHSEALPANGLAALRRAADDAQASLRARARLLGDRLFSERPSDLSKRLRSYWDSALGLAAFQSRSDVVETAPAPKRHGLKPRVHRRPPAKRPRRVAARASRPAPRRSS